VPVEVHGSELWISGESRKRGRRAVTAGRAVERDSEHPLAAAIVRYADELRIPAMRAEGFKNVPGHGAIATVDGHRVAVGNLRLLHRERVAFDTLADKQRELAGGGQMTIGAAVDGRAAGVIGLADAPRPTAAASVAQLRQAGVTVVMLTGSEDLVPDAGLALPGQGPDGHGRSGLEWHRGSGGAGESTVVSGGGTVAAAALG
jgi:cation transport ATPase